MSEPAKQHAKHMYRYLTQEWRGVKGDVVDEYWIMDKANLEDELVRLDESEEERL